MEQACGLIIFGLKKDDKVNYKREIKEKPNKRKINKS